MRSTCGNCIASPHVFHFVLYVVFSCLLRYDLKLKVSDWPLNINILLFYTEVHFKRAAVDTKDLVSKYPI